MYQFTFPLNVYEVFLFTTPLSAFVISCLFHNRPPNRCEVASHCGFDLHFSDDSWCWAPFLAPIDHLDVFCGKMSLHCLCPLFNLDIWCFVLLLSYKSSLYILDINSIYKGYILCTWFANTFSHSIDCLFILLMVSFWMQKIFSFVTELRFRGSLLKSLIIRDKCWVKRKIALLRKLAVLGEGGLVAPVINSLKSPGIFWRLDRKKRKGPHAAEGLIFCFHRWLFPSRGSK